MEEIDGRIIILILFVVISAIKWFIEKVKGPSQEQHDISESIEDIYEDFRDEIRQRQTRTVGQEQPVGRVSAPPPLPPSPVTTPRPQTEPIKYTFPQKPRKVSLSAEQQAAAARFQQRALSRRKPSAQGYVRTLLSNPHSTRQAIILAEILGKPKSLQNS